jgi:CBS domain containing-hemolysin-like protein
MAENGLNTILVSFPQSLLSTACLLLVQGLLAAAEYSLLRLRFSHFSPDWHDLWPDRRHLHRMMEQADAVLRALRLGQALALLLFAVLVLPGWAAGLHGLAAPLGLAGAWLVAALGGLALWHLLGDLGPRALGLGWPLAVFHATAPFTITWYHLARPLTGGLMWLLHGCWRLLTREAPEDMEALAFEEQIESLHEIDPEASPLMRTILRNAVQMRELVVADVLLPRHLVQYFNLHDGTAVNLALARRTGHTRFPLCQGDLDRCIGLIHIKDLFRQSIDPARLDLRALRRDIIRVGAEEPLEAVLGKLLAHKMHMALVIDEFRGVEGVVTLERILEELVGDIRDEFDIEEEARIRSDGEAGAVVSGLTPLHELEEAFDIEIEDETVSTLGGLITSELGRIPEAGEVMALQGLRITVTEVDETRVIRVRVERLPATAADGGP